MSQQLLKTDVMFYQRFLKCNGFYPFTVDGDWGPNTDAADAAFTKQSEAIADELGRFHPRSEANILTLTPKVQKAARRFLRIFKDASIDVRIISGTRTYAEQEALFRKGRFGSKENKVTNARGGQSNHNFGIAWDIGLFEHGQYITTDSKYRRLAEIALPHFPELEWGGSWKKFPDIPHYQHVVTVNGVAGVKSLFEEGNVYV